MLIIMGCLLPAFLVLFPTSLASMVTIEVYEGNNVSLPCEALRELNGKMGEVDVLWYKTIAERKKTQQIALYRSRSEEMTVFEKWQGRAQIEALTGSLYLVSVHNYDDDVYTCQASHAALKKSKIYLMVKTSVVVNIFEEPKRSYVLGMRNVTLYCSVKLMVRQPFWNLTVTWSLRREQLGNEFIHEWSNQKVHEQQSESVIGEKVYHLTIPEINAEQGGKYSCHVTKWKGNKEDVKWSDDFDLNVWEHITTRVVQHDANSRPLEGTTLGLFCGVYPISFRYDGETFWERGNNSVENNTDKYRREYNGRLLTIQSLGREDDGNYRCSFPDVIVPFTTHSLDVKVIATQYEVYGRERSDMTIHCPGYTANERNNGKNISMIWYKDEERIMDINRYCPETRGTAASEHFSPGNITKLYICQNMETLRMFHLTISAAGTYKCNYPHFHNGTVHLRVNVVPGLPSIIGIGNGILADTVTNLKCTISRIYDALVDFEWTLDGVNISENISTRASDGQSGMRTVVSILHHTFLRGDNHLTLMCTTIVSYPDSTADTQSTRHNITVYYPFQTQVVPAFNLTMAMAVRGDAYTLHCVIVAQGHPAGGREVIWLQEGTVIESNNASERLHIDMLEMSHGGEYTCLIDNNVTVTPPEHALSYQLQIWCAPTGRPVLNLEQNSVLLPADITITCNTSFLSHPGHPVWVHVHWMKDSVTLSNKSSTDSQLELELHSIQQEGFYSCMVANEYGNSLESEPVFLHLESEPVIENIKNRTHLSVEYDEEFEVACVVSGTSVDHVEWHINGKHMDKHPFFTYQININGTFAFNQTSATKYVIGVRERNDTVSCTNVGSFSGHYMCVTNGSYEDQWFQKKSPIVTVEVQYPPMWKPVDKEVIKMDADNSSVTHQVAAALADRRVALKCSVCAHPAPIRFTWGFPNGFLLTHSNYMIEADSLIIAEVRPQDFTTYICNVHGVSKRGTYMETFTIQLIENGPPSAPDSIQISADYITSQSVALWWRRGSDGGYPPLTYIIQYKPQDGHTLHTATNTTASVITSSDAVHATISPLQPNTTYEIRVTASNNRPLKEGNCTSSTVIIFATTKGRPYARISKVVITEKNLTVHWDIENNSQNIQVKILYRQDSLDYHAYPRSGYISANQSKVTIIGDFDERVSIDIRIQLYEGDMNLPAGEVELIHLKPQYQYTELSEEMLTLAVALPIILFLIIVVTSVVTCYLHRHKQKVKDGQRREQVRTVVNMEYEDVEMRENSSYESYDDMCRRTTHPNIYEDLYEEVWDCSQSSVSGISQLEQGHLARWCLATMTHSLKPVLLKMLKAEASAFEIKLFMDEVKAMKMISSHRNVLRLIGQCLIEDPPFLVFEYAGVGNLRNFLMYGTIQFIDGQSDDIYMLPKSTTNTQNAKEIPGGKGTDCFDEEYMNMEGNLSSNKKDCKVTMETDSAKMNALEECGFEMLNVEKSSQIDVNSVNTKQADSNIAREIKTVKGTGTKDEDIEELKTGELQENDVYQENQTISEATDTKNSNVSVEETTELHNHQAKEDISEINPTHSQRKPQSVDKKHKPSDCDITEDDKEVDIPLNQLINFVKDIASGLKYLHDRQMIATELNCSSIWLTEGLVCRLSSFALADDVKDRLKYDMIRDVDILQIFIIKHFFIFTLKTISVNMSI